MYIGHYGGLICLVCLEVRPALLGSVGHIGEVLSGLASHGVPYLEGSLPLLGYFTAADRSQDRKSTRLNSSHDQISYAVFCLKKKNNRNPLIRLAQLTS